MLTKPDKKMIAGKKMDESSMGNKAMPPAKTEITIKKTEPAEKTEGTTNSAVFPKKGEKVTPYEKRYGDLKITELQVPESKNWINGQSYKLEVVVVQRESELEQDTKYDKNDERIATSEPYNVSRCEILSVSVPKASTEKK